jgi:HD-GYP domain-containing protein (c-di-GMP phosphodiesterase class II)
VKVLPTAALEPDGAFDASVYLDENYILTAPDTRITRELIARLEKWEYTTVLTDGQPVARPSAATRAGGASTVTSLDDDIRDRQRDEESVGFVAELIAFAEEFFGAFQEQNTLASARLTELMKQAIAMVKANRNSILRFGEPDAASDSYLASYSVNTALLSVAIGDFLKLPPHKLIELGIAAFLHDIGMTKVPASVMSSGKPLTPDEKKSMMYHTVIGYRLLRAYSLSEEVALGALEHHERMDGSGYPRRVAPEKLSLTGRIIAVACSYVAATSRRRYKAARDGHAAIRELLAHKRYDPGAVKALLYTLSLYPLGSFVLLSNQAQGVVVETNQASPRLPLVRLLVGPDGGQVTKRTIVRTSDEDGVTVSRPLTRQEAERLKAKIGKQGQPA